MLQKVNMLVVSLPDRIRIKCVMEVHERLRITNLKNSEGIKKVDKAQDTLIKFDQEI